MSSPFVNFFTSVVPDVSELHSAAPDLSIDIGQCWVGNGEWRKVGAPSLMHRVHVFG